MRGDYMVLKAGGEVIADTTKVELKIVVDQIEATTQDSGLVSSYVPGKYKIGMAGEFLYSDDWDTLYGYYSSGNQLDVTVYLEDDEYINGYGIIKKLRLQGRDSTDKVTGAYGIRFFIESITAGGLELMTEDGFDIITEDGINIITEDDIHFLLNDLNQIMTNDSYNRIYID